MKTWIHACVCGLALISGAARSGAQSPQPEPVVQLPALLVEGSAKLPPWLYVKVDGEEYLSRCSVATTREYVEAWRARRILLNWLVPPQLFARLDVPMVTILYSQRLKNAAQEEMMAEVLRSRGRRNDSVGNSQVGAVPNMKLDDVDGGAVFAYVDEGKFERTTLTLATDFVQFLLAQRTPALPPWLVHGIAAIYSQSDFTERPITFRPCSWTSPAESAALATNPAALRTLVSAADLFSEAAWREEPVHSPRGQTLRAQSALLLRWALDPRHGVKEAWWRFVMRALEEPVTEALFEANFGFGFSDLRDRLSDYLPLASRVSVQLPLGRLPLVPRIEVRPATPTETARLRGEWERLTIAYVQRKYPQFADRYIEQARRTLQRAYESGDRDPRLFAAMGLCEIDAGNPAGAREFLERAVAENVVRPRAYYELARLRLSALPGASDASREWDEADIKPIVEPLRAGLSQSPLLASSFSLFADAWSRCGTAPSEGDWALLRLGARHHAHTPAACFRIAATFARHGKPDEAIALLAKGFPHVTDNATRRLFAQLYAQAVKASGK